MGFLRLGLKIVAGLVGLVVLYLAFTFGQVWWASRHDTNASASAIVVMGAAQYNGRPSPVLKARLDHAVELYHDGRAPMIIVTGDGCPLYWAAPITTIALADALVSWRDAHQTWPKVKAR